MTQKDCKSCKNMTEGKDHTTDEYNLSDQFPIGMRVLAVDDNSTCLMLLETVLRKCQYNVTTAKSAVAALELLRQSKNKFDLVISDVHMPDMDGFKLLEVLGLEMDLPVIMLSVNDDPKMVLKGITHGACDYLLKPVRMEELGNIWQHVIRKKGSNKTSNQDKPNSDSCNERSASTGTSDQNGKSSKKRKDEDEEDDEEQESFHDNEESTQKKRRIVWNPQLHCKFVAAVNQLGVDKAVPKKILDLMNEEKLTRENVASHLQKYRLYLKKISQQGNLMVAVGSADTSYLRMGSLNGHLPTPSGPQHFCNNVLRSYPLDGITMPLSETLRQGTIPPTDNLSFANLQGGNLSAASSITSLSSQSHDLLTDMHSQGVIFTNNPGQISNNVPFQGWDYHNQSGSYHSHVIGNSLISVNGDVDPEGYASMNSTFNRNLELSFCDPLQMKHDGGMRLNEQTSSKLQEGYIMNQHKSHNSCVTNKNLGSLEDLVNAMINRNKTR